MTSPPHRTDSSFPQGRVLQVGPLMPSLSAQLAEVFGAVELPEGPRMGPFLTSQGSEFVAVVTSGTTGVSQSLMDALPNLAAIVNFGVGCDATDLVEARRRGIAFSNTPSVLDDCVADTAVGALIDVMRGLSAADRFVRRGDWADGGGRFPLTSKVSGSAVGIVGLGRIGMAIAHRLEAFGMVISYHNRTPRSDVPYRYVDSLPDLASDSVVLVVAAAGGASSVGLISAKVLKALGPQGYLVNVARGSLVDEDALVSALREGAIAGAALDVYADEPHVPSELLTMDSVVLLPHLGSGTWQTRRAMADLVIRNLTSFLQSGRLVTPVALTARQRP